MLSDQVCSCTSYVAAHSSVPESQSVASLKGKIWIHICLRFKTMLSYRSRHRRLEHSLNVGNSYYSQSKDINQHELLLCNRLARMDLHGKCPNNVVV